MTLLDGLEVAGLAGQPSPGGDPIKYNYKIQAVVAVALKNADGAQHWPNCG